MATGDIPSPPPAEKEKIQCPIPYDELNRETLLALKPHYFEGLRVDFTKGLNQKFALSHSLMMGPTEVPTKSAETIKIPTSHYEFGANFFDPKLMLIGRVMTDGRLHANAKYDLSENLSVKANAQLSNEPNMSQGVANFDYKGTDYRAQVQLGNGGLVGANYIQSVTPKLSLGGEVFWSGQYRKSGLGYALRYATDKMVATGQIASTGLVGLGYVQRVSEKVSLASDFMYNHSSRDATASFGYDCIFRQSVTPKLSLGGEVFWSGQYRKSGLGYALRYATDKMVATGQIASTGLVGLGYVQRVSEKVSLASDFMYNHSSRDATASFGYDCIFRQCRLRGKIDSNGCTSAFVEENLNVGLKLCLSAEIDHKKKDYKFGFGLTVGE